MAEWMPISSAPKTGKVVLFYADGLHYMNRADDYWNKASWLRTATHWMELPAPPTEQANEL